MKIKWIVGGLLWASSYLQAAAQEYKLWYDEPAQVWTEALPLGNGRWERWYSAIPVWSISS